MLGSVLTRGQRRVLAAADLMVPLLKLLAVALYLPLLVGAESCTAATSGLTNNRDGRYYVSTNAQLLGLSKCTSIDYLWIRSCSDCTQIAWCGLQLQSITGKDPTYGYSLDLYNTPGFSDMCGVRNLNGALTGRFGVTRMNGLVSLDGMEGITSMGVGDNGISIFLYNNPILTSAIALTNTEYPAGTLYIAGNTDLECVPSAWPATDRNGKTIPHGSCSTTPAPTPAPGSIGSTGGDMLVVIAVIIAALACAAGFVYYRGRASAAHTKGDPLQKSLLDGNELEMGSLGPNVPHTSQPDIPHTFQPDIPHTSQPDIPHTSPPLDMDPNALNPVGSPEFEVDEL